jgi:predicted aconitase with swiveling domain
MMDTRPPCSVRLQGRKISGGRTEGEALVAKTRLSFWGGFDPATGMITEKGNPLEGQTLKNKVVVFISTKGSSGTSNMLNLAKRCGAQPAAFINTELDCLAVIGCQIHGIPMVTDLDQDPFAVIQTGDWVTVDADRGIVEVSKRALED